MFLIDSYQIKKISKKNRGAFATADIPAGTIIGDYLGTLIHDKDEDEEKQGLYGMPLSASIMILADPKKVGIHFINHSCAPNTAMYPAGNHTVYFAVRKILHGEEITVNYLLGQPDKTCNPCRHACHCGEEFCQGSMHCAEEDVKEYLAFESEIQKKQKRIYQVRSKPKVYEQLQPLTHYPKIVLDYSAYPIYASSKKKPVTYQDAKLPSRNRLRLFIRSTGRACYFAKLGITVTAIRHNTIHARI
ncbi:MAG: SET domain-containing protein [Patescibacteria group bacterium]